MNDEEFEFNDEHFEMVLRITNRIESRMKVVIGRYLEVPTTKLAFLESHVLNNSITSFGAKTKLIFKISSDIGVKVDRNAFHILLSRRNAFAHQDFASAIRVIRDPEGASDVQVVVESVKSSGELETINREQAFFEFMSAFIEVEKSIELIYGKLNILS
jgi:hypothetical protein